jgi:hypothetical protein
MVEASRSLRAALTPADLDQTLSQVTAAAVAALPEAQHASITLKHADGRLETVAPTDDFLLAVDAAQYEYLEGPCYEAVVTGSHYSAPRLAEDPRWPRYAEVAVAAGIYAQAGLHLFTAKASTGALNLYSARPARSQGWRAA